MTPTPSASPERERLAALLNSLGIAGPNIYHRLQTQPDPKDDLPFEEGWCVCGRIWPCEAKEAGDIAAGLILAPQPADSAALLREAATALLVFADDDLVTWLTADNQSACMSTGDQARLDDLHDALRAALEADPPVGADSDLTPDDFPWTMSDGHTLWRRRGTTADVHLPTRCAKCQGVEVPAGADSERLDVAALRAKIEALRPPRRPGPTYYWSDQAEGRDEAIDDVLAALSPWPNIGNGEPSGEEREP